MDSNRGYELQSMTFRCEWGACMSSILLKESQYWLDFSTGEYTEALESSEKNDGRSMLAMFLTVLFEVEGLET